MLRDFGIANDDARVNPNGGAIALGHLFGACGARLATTAGYQLHRSAGPYVLCAICTGVVQDVALVLDRF